MAARTNRRFASVGLLLLAAGCAAKPPSPGAHANSTGGQTPAELGNASSLHSDRALQGGRRAVVRAVHLDMYQFTVPHGGVSRSEEFWKRVDEQRIDVATYDLLLKNGLRVGVA